jgi:large subunit ribosomal protein L13
MVYVRKSTRPISDTEIARTWHLVDVSKKHLGREIPAISKFLQGKHKVTYTQNLDMGDYVVVINAKEVQLTGKKESQKEYSYFSGYPSGNRTVTFKEMMKKNAKEVIRHAVSGMLPKNKMRDPRLARLYIFEGAEHPYGDKFTK